MMLSEEEQWNEPWENGTFLTHHIKPGEKFSIYGLYDFFVEVELDTRTDKIVGKAHFKTGESQCMINIGLSY